MNKYSGDFESQEHEDFCRREHEREANEAIQQEPDVVPCFNCLNPMYQNSSVPMDNICEDCNNKL